MLAALSCALLQITVPPPRGYVNDFAGVLDATSVAHMTAVITELREKTRGEIAVTLTGGPGVPPGEGAQPLPIPLGWIVVAVVLLIVLARGRILLLPLWFAGWGRGGGGWSGGRGGGWGGGGGGFGGGFGGFGGGGGFSGGGAGGRF